MEDKTKGKGEQLKGKAKEKLGEATKDRSTEWSGKGEQIKGKAREAYGDLKEKAKEAEHEAERERLEEESRP